MGNSGDKVIEWVKLTISPPPWTSHTMTSPPLSAEISWSPKGSSRRTSCLCPWYCITTWHTSREFPTHIKSNSKTLGLRFYIFLKQQIFIILASKNPPQIIPFISIKRLEIKRTKWRTQTNRLNLNFLPLYFWQRRWCFFRRRRTPASCLRPNSWCHLEGCYLCHHTTLHYHTRANRRAELSAASLRWIPCKNIKMYSLTATIPNLFTWKQQWEEDQFTISRKLWYERVEVWQSVTKVWFATDSKSVSQSGKLNLELTQNFKYIKNR